MKKNLILLSLCMSMNSCVIDKELEATNTHTSEMQIDSRHYTMNEEVEKQEIPEEAFSHVKLNFRNEMSSLHLVVESIQMCNIHLSGTYHFPTEYSEGYWKTDTTKNSLTIETGAIELAPYQEFLLPQEGTLSFIPQSNRAWNPVILPQNCTQTYLLVNCKIYQIHDTEKGYQEGQEALIWGDEKGNCAELAIPLSVHFLSNQEHSIAIELSTDCTWYNINGSQPVLALVPITFDVSVDDWEEVSS